ncbi:MAG: hypothetical protein ACOCQD_05330 [archaeon]
MKINNKKSLYEMALELAISKKTRFERMGDFARFFNEKSGILDVYVRKFMKLLEEKEIIKTEKNISAKIVHIDRDKLYDFIKNSEEYNKTINFIKSYHPLSYEFNI